MSEAFPVEHPKDTPPTPGNDELPPKLRSAIDECLSADYKPGEPPPVPASFKIDNPRDAVKTALEMVGGIPRLAHYADKNFDSFVKGPFSKVITAQQSAPKEGGIEIVFRFDLGNRFGQTVEGVAVAEVISEQPKELVKA